MPRYDNLTCITELVGVTNPCASEASQALIEYNLNDNGISLNTAAKAADERYIEGQTLVDAKIAIALDDVYTHLTRNTTKSCDLDKATGILCDEKQKIARAVWYRATALIFKEIAIDSKRYSDIIHYAGTEALAQLIYFDSSFIGFTTLENVPAGQYQRQLEKLEPVRAWIEQTCCTECTGSQWQITIP